MGGVEIAYDGKKPERDILALAAQAPKIALSSDKSAFIHGDNFTVMASLIASGYAGAVDLVYIDPPFNTNQTFKTAASHVGTISRSGSEVAYDDDREFSAYLEFMRERLILLRELLSDEGSIYVHIDCKVGHYLKVIMDEVFGASNFQNDIARIKSNPKNFKRAAYGNQRDMLLFYARNKGRNIFNDLTVSLTEGEKKAAFEKVDADGRRYTTVPAHAPGESAKGETGGPWRGMMPPAGRHWRTSPDELDRLDEAGLVEWSRNGVPRIKRYADDHKGKKVQDVWRYLDPQRPVYPTEKNLDMLKAIIGQSSREDSLVLDAFAGSGSTLVAAHLAGRRWIGIDASDVSERVVNERLSGLGCEYERISFAEEGAACC